MKVNPLGLDIIKECEGFRSISYLCPSGVPTIGWGHTKGVYLGMVCTTLDAQKWLEEDLAYYCKVINCVVKVPLTDNQFSALVSFVFNIGVTSFMSSTMLKLLNQKQYDAIPEQFQRWVYGKDPRTRVKIKLPGLVKRRSMEADLWSKA